MSANVYCKTCGLLLADETGAVMRPDLGGKDGYCLSHAPQGGYGGVDNTGTVESLRPDQHDADTCSLCLEQQ